MQLFTLFMCCFVMIALGKQHKPECSERKHKFLITVPGSAIIKLKPSQATVTFAVEIRSKNAKDALR